jgi:hypothetical protein
LNVAFPPRYRLLEALPFRPTTRFTVLFLIRTRFIASYTE